MDEDERNSEVWQNDTNPHLMLQFTRARVSDRKLRLFAVACARFLLNSAPDLGDTRLVGIAEACADGEVTESERVTAERLARTVSRQLGADAAGYAAGVVTLALARVPRLAAQDSLATVAAFDNEIRGSASMDSHVALVREVFGNPFQPIDFAPWRTDTAVTLARQMYDSRDFGAMPILADALQDAGCDNAEVLNHCRDANQTHVRGCWVVDGVLGKE